MSYGYSSAYSRVPNLTPQPSTSIRPPIHNPYDKFTQPQFDEWIGGITSALRKALGQEEEEIPTPQAATSRVEDAHPASDIDEDSVEDSLAGWKAIRAKEKGKMRATEDEQGNEHGDSQDSCEDSDAQDHAAGNTPSDAIELLSDEDDARGEEVHNLGEHDNEANDGGLIEDFSPVKSDRELPQPYVGTSQPTMPPKLHSFFVNTPGQGAIEISDDETEDHGQGDDSFDTESLLFGWGQEEEGEGQQPPDIRDPWESPKTYAEDLYTGGPVREADRSRLSPSHLTPAAEEADYFDNIDPQLRPSSALTSQPTDHNLAQISQGSATPALIPPTTDEVSNDHEASSCDEDILGVDIPTTTAPRDELDFISFTALNQPSDMGSERGGPEILYISDNDGGETSGDDEEAEEDEFDDGGPIPLGTSDLEIPAEHELEEDGGEEFDELEEDDEPIAEVTTNLPYGYYGLDASSVTGSGGLDDETRTVGPPSDPPKGDQSEAPDLGVSQESASLLDPHDLMPLPAVTTFIEIDRHIQLVASVVAGDTTKVDLAEVSLASVDGAPIIPDRAAVNEDASSADEDSVGGDTILADEAVLTVNEVEEVLRDAFAEADQLVSVTNAREGGASESDITPSLGEQAARTSPKPDPSDITPEVFAGEGPLPDKPVEPSPSATRDGSATPQEAQKEPLPFIMPLIANPNVRDPMSAPWSPVQSGPSTPVAGVAYLHAVTKFKRDNQLLGTAHTSSGLFTPLEGSGSSSPPSPSDTATPKDRLSVEVETGVLVVDDDKQHQEEQATSALASLMSGSPEIPEVEAEAVPIGPPEDHDWGEIPRLPTPPTEIMDHVDGALPTDPVTRIFFQPESIDNVEGLDPQSEADRDDPEDGDALSIVAVDIPRVEKVYAPGSTDAELFIHLTNDTANSITKDRPEVTGINDPFKLMGNNSTVAPGAVTDDNDESSMSSSLDEEATPR
ncbi:hypothetical protein BDM02DRAFT_2279947 [Thelephora ganbajun]|uniref:Uncharacterized protein n=1 Tax=Thelephora ganbajun TaxID=370292 RepID=A0ACB6ZFB2_THEGA|nr:hypothetical protein BDM02DRAFT_2279947 [Thelephora ganbajun]